MKIKRTRIHFFCDSSDAVTNLGSQGPYLIRSLRSVYPYPPPLLLPVFALVLFFALPKPEIPFLGLCLLQNKTKQK